MKKYLINALIFALIFIATILATLISSRAREGLLWVDKLGLSHGIGLLLAFILVFAISSSSLIIFQKRIGVFGIIFTISIVILMIISKNVLNTNIKNSYKLSPYYISWFLGLVAGIYFYLKAKKSYKQIFLLALFPLFMSFNLYDIWVNKIEYGSFFGTIEEKKIINFNLINKDGIVVDQSSLRGKIVLLDFWFINCGPCWTKFPHLQKIYEKYESNPLVEVYAVNRPMPKDGPNQLFELIEEKGYTFPVLKGTQEALDNFEVYVYPTIILLNQNGEIKFRGKIEDAESILESLLK